MDERFAIDQMDTDGAGSAISGGAPSLADYQAALERYETICRDLPVLRTAGEQLIEGAYAEWDAAHAALKEFEIEPGLPKPEYRQALLPVTDRTPALGDY